MAIAVSAVGLALVPAPVLAQDAAQATDAPPSDAIGPRELQNFSLNGTVTRQAEPVAPPRAAPTRVPPPSRPTTDVTRSSGPPSEPTRRAPSATAATVPAPSRSAANGRSQSRPASSVTTALPAIDESPVAAPPAASAAGFSSDPGNLDTGSRVALWPWLLAALALGAGGAFLLWRNRSREAFAGGPQFDAFTAPEPAPAPVPAPAPPQAPPAPPPGVVSTRLRPWIDLGFQPLRCVVEDHQVTIEFDITLQNSGSAPARGVLVEASLFNAGPTQDQAIRTFFDNPAGLGERIAVIPPLKNVVVRTKVVAPRENVAVFEAGGRQVFIPLIAFNALYSGSSGEGQTSASYLLGRDTKGEKMAPFRLDLGPRVFRGVGARPLPSTVRN